MRRRNTIGIAVLALILACGLLIMRTAASTGESTAQESMEQCSKKKNAPRADKMTWENLSRQFFSSI